MKNERACRRALLQSLVILTLWTALSISGRAATAKGGNGIVATGHPLATQAGLDVLKLGSNAVDAAIAVGLTLGVVDGHYSVIDGGCVMFIRQAIGRLAVLDGRETAPLAARSDLFLRNGVPFSNTSHIWLLTISTPSALLTYNDAAG